MDRRLLQLITSKDFNERGSWQKNPGLLEGEVRWERCVTVDRERPHPQTQFPVSGRLCSTLYTSSVLSLTLCDWALHSQSTLWAEIHSKWATAPGHPPVWLHLCQPHLYQPLPAVWALLSKRKKRLEDRPQPSQVRPGGLSPFCKEIRFLSMSWLLLSLTLHFLSPLPLPCSST